MSLPPRLVKTVPVIVVVALLLTILSGIMLSRFLRPQRLGNNRTVRAIFNQNPPYYHLPLGGQPEGAMIELFNQAARRKGIQLEWVLWQAAPEELMRAGRAELVFLSVVSPARQREFHLTEPWLRVEAQLIWRKTPEHMGLPDLSGKQLGVPGYRLYEDMARKHFPSSKIVRRASRIDLVEMVCEGALEAAVVDARSISMVLLDRPKSCQGTPLGMDSIQEADNALAIMSTKNVANVAESIRDSISEMGSDGSMRAVYQKWGVGFLPETRMLEEIRSSQANNRILIYLLAGAGVLIVAVVLLAIRLRRAQVKADLASDAKSAFLATMSHETRTPLNGIIGLAEALEEEATNPSHKGMASSIAQCGRSLVALVNDVLDHSKLDAEKLTLKRETFSLRGVLQPVVESLGAVARQKGIDLQFSIAPDVPAWCEGDSLRITQVIFNLLGNAIKFTEHGVVGLHLSMNDSQVRFEVSDTGIGLSELERQQLFQAFWQGDQGTTRKYEGTGLGLSISQRLIVKMGGTIGVGSEKGKGSTFWFQLALPPREVPRAEVPTVVPNSTRPLKILFADDNLVNQKVVERLILKLGHAVELVSDGAQAVERFQSGEFDIILMDCHMPVEDGFSAAARIRSLEKDSGNRIPIILNPAVDHRQCSLLRV
jgi:signal transduction histidine kinase/CheY-like chemotaxis protein